jgi:hypothetical protein
VKIDGIKERKIERVDLAEYFDREAWVDVKAVNTVARAEIREINSAGLEFEQKGSDPKAGYRVRGTAEDSENRQRRLRNRKLSSGYVDHCITAEGSKVPWGEELWDALEDVEPRIIERITQSIDRLSGGYQENPFSVTERKKR